MQSACIEQILTVLVGMIDVMMVAAVGEAAVSGVSLVDSVSMLIIQLMAAMATGGAVVCSQYIGKQQPESACHAAGQLILITTGCAAVFAGIAPVGGRHLLSLIFGQVEQAVRQIMFQYGVFDAHSILLLFQYHSGWICRRSSALETRSG